MMNIFAAKNEEISLNDARTFRSIMYIIRVATFQRKLELEVKIMNTQT